MSKTITITIEDKDKTHWKDKRPTDRSIWDSSVSISDLDKMSKEEKAKNFPNDYNANGEPYGDF